MKLLLVSNYFSEGNTGNMVLKALNELGHSCYVWDTNLSKIPLSENYDIALAWTNNYPNPNLLKPPKILYFLDDPRWWELNDKNKSIENLAPNFDYVYTCMKIPGYKWMPMGNDPEIHKKIYSQKGTDISFIGTLRDRERFEFILRFKALLSDKSSFRIYGNNWPSNISGWQGKAVYFSEFNRVCNDSRIVLNQHFCNGPSTKDLEIPATGTLMISDYFKGIKELYPNTPVYEKGNVKEAVELCKYYLEHEEEREKLAKEMQQQAYVFSYKNQLKKILDEIRWE